MRPRVVATGDFRELLQDVVTALVRAGPPHKAKSRVFIERVADTNDYATALRIASQFVEVAVPRPNPVPEEPPRDLF